MIWQLIASFLAARPALVDWLIRRAKHAPYFHILGRNGAFYMGRWWLIKMRPWLPFSVRIHHIALPDEDRDLHDHPFNYRTIILRGWYVEESIYGKLHQRDAGHTVANTAQTFHRIAQVSPGGVWTLFIMGRRINGWGFLVNSRKVPYRTYLGIDDNTTGA
jgi:hypothetical protein